MSKVAELIRAEIGREGAIPFARFMELALYCPLYGYYERKEDTTGRAGDFYTSVSVGPLFGQLLAYQFAAWAAEEAPSGPVKIVEAGAHDGRLGGDILAWLQRQRPEVFDRLEYIFLEPSSARQEWQTKTMQPFAGKVRWVEALTSSPDYTVIVSNELLDAFPVHRLGWDATAKSWFEWGVTVEANALAWTRLPLPSSLLPPPSSFQQLPTAPELLAVLPDGFTTEVCPAAEHWWRDAARALQRGKLLAFDYGLEADEFFSPQRAKGTLRAYHRHQVSDDLLARPGEQDLTAQVNITAIRSAGENAGLTTEKNVSQARFLTDIAQQIWREGSGFGEWTREHTRQFQTLTHPQHLGRAFRALLQRSSNVRNDKAGQARIYKRENQI